MKKYRLKNLDCPTCALELEQSLNEMDGVKRVSINFETESMRIDADDMDSVIKLIKREEPGIKVLKEDEGEEGDSIKKELAFILIAAVLFVAGMIFRSDLHSTPYSAGEYLVFLSSYFLSGWSVLSSAGKNMIHGKVFDENFLLTVATIGAIAIHELPEAVGVMLFFQVGELLQAVSVNHSRRSIKSLLEIRPDHANLLVGKDVREVSPEEVVPGDIILVKPGEKIPLDGKIIEGVSQLDTSPLTGESVPRSAKQGDMALAGSINKGGLLKIRVTRPMAESSIYRILDMVENARNKKSETERFITRFARYYTPAVVFSAMMVAVIPPLVLPGATFSEWLYRALILLVISCPCALVISIPLGYFGGVGRASKEGILVKGSKFLDTLAGVRTVVFDKTGTLTKGVFMVTKVVPANGFRESEVIAMAAAAEAYSSHPIATSIMEASGEKGDISQAEEYEEISGHGIKAKVGGRTVMVGNDRLLHKEGVEHPLCNVPGTVVHVVVDGVYAGYISISDEPKDDARESVKRLREVGIKRMIMLTGDNEAAARQIAEELGMDEYHADLLPQDKLRILEEITRNSSGKIAYVGDGINDAPVLARADVGIAMGALGSEAAIETADVVIMTESLSRIPEAVRIGRKTRRIIWQNIIFALTVKIGFIIFGMVGAITMWEAVFADVGVALIALLNATRILRAKDINRFSPSPIDG